MSMNFSCDNAGNRVPPHPHLSAPEAGTGQSKTCTIGGTNYTLTVEAGRTYKVLSTANTSSIGNYIALSITGTAVTDANKEWVAVLGYGMVITIPKDKTTLNIVASLSGTIVYLVRLQN